jgi:hypothetical protein
MSAFARIRGGHTHPKGAQMFSSYKVLPMAADGYVYALYDPKGDQVAMGTREVCQTLLYLVTNSSLMERPSRYGERVAPKQRVSPAAAPAEGGAEFDAAGEAGAKSFDGPRPSEAPYGIKLSAPVTGPGGRPTPTLSVAPYGVSDLFYLGGQSVATHWYVGLFVAIVIGSALLTWALFSSL